MRTYFLNLWPYSKILSSSVYHFQCSRWCRFYCKSCLSFEVGQIKGKMRKKVTVLSLQLGWVQTMGSVGQPHSTRKEGVASTLWPMWPVFFVLQRTLRRTVFNYYKKMYWKSKYCTICARRLNWDQTVIVIHAVLLLLLLSSFSSVPFLVGTTLTLCLLVSMFLCLLLCQLALKCCSRTAGGFTFLTYSYSSVMVVSLQKDGDTNASSKSADRDKKWGALKCRRWYALIGELDRVGEQKLIIVTRMGKANDLKRTDEEEIQAQCMCRLKSL